MPYRATKHFSSKYGAFIEGSTITGSIPKKTLKHWLERKLIEVGHGDRIVDESLMTGTEDAEDEGVSELMKPPTRELPPEVPVVEADDEEAELPEPEAAKPTKATKTAKVTKPKTGAKR